MASTQADLTVSPFYHQAKNEIVQPGHFVACSRYFVQHWIPLLGGTAVSLILQLRSLGYYNPHTGELRDGVRIGIKKLAALCGCSDRTIQREIENNAWLAYFVRVESSYEQLPDGRIRHHENLYRIAMDDPLIPEHEPRLEALIEQRERDWQAQGAKRGTQVTRRKNASTHREARDIGITNTKLSDANTEFPVNDNLSPPPTDHARQSVTRVASKCRVKDSEDIPSGNIHSDIHNNTTDGPISMGQTNGETRASVVAVASLSSEMEKGDPQSNALAAELARQGVSIIAARNIASLFDENDIRLQLEALPFRDAKDPAAVLVKSIRESWALPAALFESQTRKSQRRMEAEEDAQRTAEDTRRQADQSEMQSRIDAYWQALPSGEQARVESEVVESLRRTNGFVASLMDRASSGPIVRATIDATRRDIVRERMLKAEHL